MKKRSIILTIIVAIIYLSFAVSIGAIAVSYYNRKFTKVAESNYLEANVLESEQLSKRLNTDSVSYTHLYYKKQLQMVQKYYL